MKIIKSLEESRLLITGIIEKIQIEAKGKRGLFLSILLGTVGASLLENLLTGKGVKKSKSCNIHGQGLTSFEIQKYYQNEPKFNGVYSRDNLSKIKDVSYIINLDKYKPIGAHCIALYINYNNVTYFDRFGVHHIPKEIDEFK